MNFDKLKNSEKSLIMRNNYKRWKFDGLDEAGYFIIFQGFLETGKLREISGNALKLYIYLGINSNNFEGIVWHSNEKISKYFGKSERTIRSWMKELEDLDLLKRMRLKYDGNVYTYLQPYEYKCNPNEQEGYKFILEGELLKDEIGGLYIKGENIYIPIVNSMHIEIWNNEEEVWIPGKLEIRRMNYIWNDDLPQKEKIIYLFRSNDKRELINISNGENIKVRLLML